jgi:hypothetical protein
MRQLDQLPPNPSVDDLLKAKALTGTKALASAGDALQEARDRIRVREGGRSERRAQHRRRSRLRDQCDGCGLRRRYEGLRSREGRLHSLDRVRWRLDAARWGDRDLSGRALGARTCG